MKQITILCGSARAASVSRRLADYTRRRLDAAGYAVVFIDPAEVTLPLYDADLEARATPAALALLREPMIASAGIVFISPEYNSSLSPLMKNQIDWASRSAGSGDLSPFWGKHALIMGISPGRLGGLRMSVHLKSILGNIGMWVCPEVVTIPNAFADDGAFDEAGNLRERKYYDKALDAFCAQL